MKYEDFVLQIGPDTGQGYSVSVVKSPAGEGSGSFRPPFEDGEIGQVLHSLLRHAEAERSDDTDRDAVPAAARQERRYSPRQVGASLFGALFTGQIRTLYDQSLGRIGALPDTGLRLQIKLNPEHPDLARLYSFPWEFLYRTDTQDFLSLSRLTPVVRYLDVSRPATPYPLPSPLRVLVVIANPRGLASLDLRRERSNIETAWGRNRNVEVSYLEEASLGALREELLEKSIHVLHFMGHGGFDDRTGEGVLYFVSADGGRQPISGQVLSSKLKDFKSLRLVFLNACNTARTAGRDGVNPFAGVASALVLGGMPAVVAMQIPISDRAAIAFSRSFYQRLAAGEPVDTAVAEGRQAIHSEDSESTEWATPVLFLRTPDGALFGPPSSEMATGLGSAGGTAPKSRPGSMGTGPGSPLSALAGAPQRRSPIWKKVAAAIIVTVVLASIATVGTRMVLQSEEPEDNPGKSDNPTVSGSPTTSDILPAARKTASDESKPTQTPVTIRKAGPITPTVVYEIGQDFLTHFDQFSGRIEKVEIRGNRMRWYFNFYNQGNEDVSCGFDYGATYVADEFGNRYGVIDAQEIVDVSNSRHWRVQPGVRFDRWFEFNAPQTGATIFTVGLVSYNIYSGDVPQFKPFTVTLPK